MQNGELVPLLDEDYRRKYLENQVTWKNTNQIIYLPYILFLDFFHTGKSPKSRGTSFDDDVWILIIYKTALLLTLHNHLHHMHMRYSVFPNFEVFQACQSLRTPKKNIWLDCILMARQPTPAINKLEWAVSQSYVDMYSCMRVHHNL